MHRRRVSELVSRHRAADRIIDMIGGAGAYPLGRRSSSTSPSLAPIRRRSSRPSSADNLFDAVVAI